jgi:vacuolar-type H+-ATPase subunit H
VYVHEKLDQIVETVKAARSMPMSASCIVNRAELLAALEDLRAALPPELDRAQQLLDERDDIVAQATLKAERIVEAAKERRDRLVDEHEVTMAAETRAAEILTDVREESGRVRTEADDYIDGKLANFEVLLQKTLQQVERGRDALRGRSALTPLFAEDEQQGQQQGQQPAELPEQTAL